MAALDIFIPLLGAGVAVLSSVVKNWFAAKSQHEIVINLGNGTKITVDGSEDSRERVRKILSESFDASGPRTAENSTLRAGFEPEETTRKEQE